MIHIACSEDVALVRHLLLVTAVLVGLAYMIGLWVSRAVDHKRMSKEFTLSTYRAHQHWQKFYEAQYQKLASGLGAKYTELQGALRTVAQNDKPTVKVEVKA